MKMMSTIAGVVLQAAMVRDASSSAETVDVSKDQLARLSWAHMAMMIMMLMAMMTSMATMMRVMK